MKALHELLTTYLSDTKVVDINETLLSDNITDIFNSFNEQIPA